MDSFLLRPFFDGEALLADALEQVLPDLHGELLNIMATARLVASRFNKPFTCGIINAKSGRCSENCSFCAQSAHHDTNAPVYPLVEREKLFARACDLSASGVDYMGIVMSGAAPSERDFERLCEDALHILQRVDIRLCASLGVLSGSQAKMLKQAGFSSYHHNLEVAPSYYSQVCPSHVFESRVQTVRHAQQAGLRVCSGGIFGVGENWHQRLELSTVLQDLQVDSIPVNFLTPVKGTPLEHQPLLPAWEGLALIALLRLMHPKSDIVICGGRKGTLQRWETGVFSAGANGLMVGDYLTTQGSGFEADRELLQTLGVWH